MMPAHDVLTLAHDVMAFAHDVMAFAHDLMMPAHDDMAFAHGMGGRSAFIGESQVPNHDSV